MVHLLLLGSPDLGPAEAVESEESLRGVAVPRASLTPKTCAPSTQALTSELPFYTWVLDSVSGHFRKNMLLFLSC